jgi:hypothetical protein
MTDRLPAIDDTAALSRTCAAWHAVAEHVLAAARYAADRRIGLVPTPGGFGTPPYGDGRSARVAARELVVSDRHEDRALPLTTLGAAAAALGIEPGCPPVYTPVTPLVPDAPLDIDLGAAALLAAWFALAAGVLADMGDTVTLWPEHFDVATEAGDEARGQRGTFGASPGDVGHSEPYLYVTPWAELPRDDYWNDAAFGGASLGYGELARVRDPAARATEFYERGRGLLMQA